MKQEREIAEASAKQIHQLSSASVASFAVNPLCPGYIHGATTYNLSDESIPNDDNASSLDLKIRRPGSTGNPHRK
jgi:hypothetical protein